VHLHGVQAAKFCCSHEQRACLLDSVWHEVGAMLARALEWSRCKQGAVRAFSAGDIALWLALPALKLITVCRGAIQRQQRVLHGTLGAGMTM
jgi:hypothetical protein